MERSLKARVFSTRSATILFFLCFYFAVVLAVPASTLQHAPIAIISDGDHSDAFAKVIRSLCEVKRSNDEDDDASVQKQCRHFQDAREVSSRLMRDPQAFEAVLAEVSRCVYDDRKRV